MAGFAFLFLCLNAGAQEFVNLTAQQVRIDSLLPVFTWQKPLGPCYADSVYTVSIEYPEFIDMQPADVARYERISGRPLPQLPLITQQVGAVRKEGVLDVSFVPLVFRGGRFQKLVSFKLDVRSSARAATRAPQASSARYAEHSVLRTGNWAKIRIGAGGVYQLTDALVRKAGFADPAKVKIYGYGGGLQPERLTGDYLAATDDLHEVPTCTIGGRRLFHATGPVTWASREATVRTRNPYSDYGYYFLTDGGEAPLTVGAEEFAAAVYPLADDYHTLHEVDDFAWFHGGRNLFDQALYTIGAPQAYRLAASGTSGTLSVALTYDGDFEATVAVNGSVVGTASRTVRLDNYTKAEERVWDYELKGILKEENTVEITQTSGGHLRLDYLSLRFDTPKPMPDLQSAAFPVPEYVGRVEPQDRHVDGPADMIIIIPASQKLRAQAERLQEHHGQQDGLRVRIVTADELYNEFSSGTPDATAYRRYLKMLYDRASAPADLPRYLLLLGDGAWDNRMLTPEWEGVSPDDLLLCFESDNSFSHVNCYVSDDFFCLLDDEEQIQQERNGLVTYIGKPDVAVGRLPARTAEEAAVLVDKILSYARNEQAGAWQNVICMMGDDGNNNSHMATADRVAGMVAGSYPGYLLKKIYWDAYQRTSSATGYAYPDVTRLIQQQMEGGALMMNYCGHGAPYALSHELVMKLADFQSSVSGALPLWVTASCDIMPFDGVEENIGEAVMFNRRGGGIAFFGTTRTVYTAYNEQMNLAFTRHVLDARNTIGEAARLAKCELVSTGRDTSPNKLQYTLLGDPALRLATPRLQMVVDSINGEPAGSPVRLAAGSVVRVRGHVEQGGGPAPGFNGVVTATVRDAEERIVCKLNDTSDEGAQEAFVYTDRPKTLYRGSDRVDGGVFHFTFAVPKDISYTGGSGQLTLYAAASDGASAAHGGNTSMVFDGSGTQTDAVGPSVYCYLNSKSFVNGGKVNTTPYFVAELYDENGINVSGSSLGHDLELVVDGELSRTYRLNDYFTFDFGDYRRGTVGFSIPELGAGQHRLLFRVWDVLNNSSTSELTFHVVENLPPGSLSVACTKNPATEGTSFVISHDRPGSEVHVTVEVFDLAGRQVWSHAETAFSQGGTCTVDWDLRMAGGSRLQTGVYVYRVRVGSHDGGSTSYANKLIVVGNN